MYPQDQVIYELCLIYRFDGQRVYEPWSIHSTFTRANIEMWNLIRGESLEHNKPLGYMIGRAIIDEVKLIDNDDMSCFDLKGRKVEGYWVF